MNLCQISRVLFVYHFTVTDEAVRRGELGSHAAPVGSDCPSKIFGSSSFLILLATGQGFAALVLKFVFYLAAASWPA
jgi:hypothetical protein